MESHCSPTSQVTDMQQLCALAQNSVYLLAGLRHCFSHIGDVFWNSGAKTPRTLLLKQQSDLLKCSHLNVVSGSSTHTHRNSQGRLGRMGTAVLTAPFRTVSVLEFLEPRNFAEIMWALPHPRTRQLTSCELTGQITHIKGHVV